VRRAPWWRPWPLFALSRAGLWRGLSAALLLGLSALMVATFRDYGMTGDEGVQHRYGRKLLRWYAGLPATQPPPAEGDIAMYGGFFDLVAESAVALSPRDPFEVRHLVNVAFALAAFVAVNGIGAHLAGPAAGFVSMLFLALTPRFYGDSFNNPKDIPFAATFAVACWMILRASDAAPRRLWRAALGAGVAIGLTAAVRVAGIALFALAVPLWAAVLFVRPGHAERRSAGADVGRLAAATAAMVVVGWVVMLAFWPWAWADPVGNPLRARRAFSGFWESMIVFYDGRLVASGEVSRFYLPRWLTLVLPELYGVAAVLGAVCLWRWWREGAALSPPARIRAVQVAWIATVAVLPVAWVVATRTPLYDGSRHFLFLTPLLGVLAGIATVLFFRARPWTRGQALGAAALAASCLVTAADMVALHPYQAVYFNRVVAGGLSQALTRFEGDYWCLSYKEGAEWLARRYGHARCQERIRVAGHSILLQTAYYLRQTDPWQQRFKAVGVRGSPHYVLATTRYGDHQRTPGRLVHTVDRLGARLLYVFETKEPECE
jgi:hypothetical protein